MPRETKTNRFADAGKALVESSKAALEKEIEKTEEHPNPVRKKDKIITAKIYEDTFEAFTAINKAQGMTNSSVINMLISEYVRNRKEILK